MERKNFSIEVRFKPEANKEAILNNLMQTLFKDFFKPIKCYYWLRNKGEKGIIGLDETRILEMNIDFQEDDYLTEEILMRSNQIDTETAKGSIVELVGTNTESSFELNGFCKLFIETKEGVKEDWVYAARNFYEDGTGFAPILTIDMNYVNNPDVGPSVTFSSKSQVWLDYSVYSEIATSNFKRLVSAIYNFTKKFENVLSYCDFEGYLLEEREFSSLKYELMKLPKFPGSEEWHKIWD